MKGQNTFTTSQINEIGRLITQKVNATQDKQKGIRSKIRKLGFYYSDFSTKKNGYTVADFEVLIQSGQIKIIENSDKTIDNLFNQHENLIKGGESEIVEFKPLLFGSIPAKDKEGNLKIRNMRLEVAKVICAFLNKEGGNIYIGVNDKGVIFGADMEKKNSEDEYIRHFGQLKDSFFSTFNQVIHHHIVGKFAAINDKRVFVIQVKKSEEEPIFLYNRENKPNGSPFQFYVREGTSSKLLYDPLYLVKYIEYKWWYQKYKS